MPEESPGTAVSERGRYRHRVPATMENTSRGCGRPEFRPYLLASVPEVPGTLHVARSLGAGPRMTSRWSMPRASSEEAGEEMQAEHDRFHPRRGRVAGDVCRFATSRGPGCVSTWRVTPSGRQPFVMGNQPQLGSFAPETGSRLYDDSHNDQRGRRPGVLSRTFAAMPGVLTYAFTITARRRTAGPASGTTACVPSATRASDLGRPRRSPVAGSTPMRSAQRTRRPRRDRSPGQSQMRWLAWFAEMPSFAAFAARGARWPRVRWKVSRESEGHRPLPVPR